LLTDNDLCSHRRSWWLWAESVAKKHEVSFHAVKCKSWDNFKEGKVEEDAPMGYMGIDCPMNISGDYYLQTNGNSPYSKGTLGTSYTQKVKPASV
jgi:Lipase